MRGMLPIPAVARRRALGHYAGELDVPVVAPMDDPRELRPLPRLRRVVDLRQHLRVRKPAGDVPHLPCAPDRADAAVERTVVVERVPVHRGAEAVEEVACLAEAPV